MAVDLPGVNSADSSLHRSTDYGLDDPEKAHQVLSNVQTRPRIGLNPAGKQTLGRAAEMFAFHDPLNRGTFLPDTDAPEQFHLSSDTGSRFAIDKQYAEGF
jgi:hypothetical protein